MVKTYVPYKIVVIKLHTEHISRDELHLATTIL